MKEQYSGVLVIVRGLPGSGKTTFSETMCRIGGNVLGSDLFFMDVKGDYNFDSTRLPEAHEWCRNEVELHMKNKYKQIFVTDEFSQPKDIQPYIDLAIKHNYQWFSIVVENRQGTKNTHNISEKTMNILKNRFEIQL